MRLPLFFAGPSRPFLFYLLLLAQVFFFPIVLDAQCPSHASSYVLGPPSHPSYCYGEEITLTVQENWNAAAPFTYEWFEGNSSNGPVIGTTQSITVTVEEGVTGYRVDVIDANGCIFPGHIDVFPELWSSNLDQGHGLCGNTADLSVYHYFPNTTFTYIWSTGATSQSITAYRGETYSVTVTAASGCSKVLSGEGEFYPLPDTEITGPSGLCLNTGGTLNLEVSNPAVNIYNIEWSNGSSGSPPFNLSTSIGGPGTYSVTVLTSPGACTTTDEITIPETPPVPPIIDHPIILCPNEESTATVTNAAQYAEMNWFTNGTGAQIPVTSNNIYLLNTTEPNGCTSEAEFFVDEHFTVPPAIAAPLQICEFQEELTLQVVTPYEEYLWSTGETNQSIETASPGTYSVSTVDANGCVGTDEINIAPAPVPEPNIPISPTVCGGASQTIAVEGGPFATYEWSNGETSETIEVNASGNYAVTVSNTLGCTAEASTEVAISAGPEAAVALAENVCEGNATLTASGGASYEWSTGETTAELSVTTNGEYTVTVTDSEGCTATMSESVSISAPPVASVSGPSSFCEGSEISLAASGNFTEFNWSNGANGTSISVTQGGEYTVTATDANGCTSVASLEAVSNALPTPSISAPSGFCAGSSAQLELNSGFAEILWSNGETTQNISVSEGGNYAVTVTNAAGCESQANLEMEEYELPSANISGPSSFCEGASAELNVAGSFSDIQWSTSEEVSMITVSESGAYAVTVTDGNGCTATDEMTVESAAFLQPELTVEMENCEPLASLSPGVGYADYTWSNGETSENISVISEGEYGVTVSDGNGCSGETTVEVFFPEIPTVEITGPNSACEGEMINLTADTGFETYQWSTGETTSAIAISQPGEYTLVATDPNGCTSEAGFVFEAVPLPSANIFGPSTFCEGGSAELSVSGDFSEIIWSTNEEVGSITVSESGEYSVTVTSSEGCSASASMMVETGTSLEPQVEVEVENCASFASLSVGSGFAEITWSNGENTPTISVNDEGAYSVTVTDADGCSGVTISEVIFDELPVVGLSGLEATCEGEPTVLSADLGFEEYLWSTGETTAEITLSEPGEYTLIATDANGCTAEAAHVFSFLAPPNADLLGPSSICTGGEATFEVVGDFSEILWSTGEVGPSIQVAQAGTYVASVTNADGCTSEVTQTLEVGDALSPTITVELIPCHANALIHIDGDYDNYEWSNGATADNLFVLEEGNYSVTVSDASGCSGEAMVNVEFPTVPTVEIEGPALNCEGSEVTLSASGNFADYEWSTGETDAEISVLGGGDYSLIVTDANGCTATAEWTVEELSTQYTNIESESCHAQDTGTVVLNLTGQTGCDSVVTVVTSFVSSMTADVEMKVCAGESFLFAGTEIFGGEEEEFVFMSSQGCDSVVTVRVAEWPALEMDAETTATCWNDESGSVSLSMNTGTAPYLFSLDGGAFQAESIFENLPTGEYQVTVEDAHGCWFENTFEILETERTEITVTDGLLRCDDGTTLLVPEVVSGNADLIEWRWSTGETTMEMEADQVGTYELVADDGCEEQVFEVSVERAEDEYAGFFYVPNSFSPNGDAVNDFFKAYTSSQTQIQSFEFKVFDRWGNRMFGTSNIEEGWDGWIDGRVKQNDVYVWYLKANVEGCQGESVEIFEEGGVHLMK